APGSVMSNSVTAPPVNTMRLHKGPSATAVLISISRFCVIIALLLKQAAYCVGCPGALSLTAQPDKIDQNQKLIELLMLCNYFRNGFIEGFKSNPANQAI